MKPFKVVCVDTSIIETQFTFETGTGLIMGEIYTATSLPYFDNYRLPVIKIKGLGDAEKLYCRFRPVQDIGSSVEEHINKLIKEEDLKTISV